MIPVSQVVWPLASAAAALAFLVSKPWRRGRGRPVTVVLGALLVVDAGILIAASAAPALVAPLTLASALLVVAFGATAARIDDVVAGDSRPTSVRPVPRPSPCDNVELLRWAVDQGEPAVAVSRFDGELVFVNVAWARLHGLRSHEITGHRWSLFHTPEQMANDLRPLMAKAEADGSHEAIVGRRRPDGETFTTRTRLTLVHDPETTAAVGWVAVAFPLASGGEPSDEAGLGVEFGRRVREVAHDFNNLLSAVVGNAGLVLEQVENDPELRREVEEIESAAMRAAELATGLQSEARRVAPPSLDDASSGVFATDPVPAAEAPRPEASDAPPERPTILVVDNEKIVRDLARSVLEVRGYRVLLATDGSEAIATFTEHRTIVRAVLLDYGMPGMDGREVFSRLRTVDAGVPVVLMTGFRDNDLVGAMEREGLAGSLPKPFRPAQLVEMLERVLDRA